MELFRRFFHACFYSRHNQLGRYYHPIHRRRRCNRRSGYLLQERFTFPQRTYRILRWVLVLEAIYWISLIPMAGINVYFNLFTSMHSLSNIVWTTIPSIVESIVPPVALLILASKLSPNKPFSKAIKWALICRLRLYPGVLVNQHRLLGADSARQRSAVPHRLPAAPGKFRPDRFWSISFSSVRRLLHQESGRTTNSGGTESASCRSHHCPARTVFSMELPVMGILQRGMERMVRLVPWTQPGFMDAFPSAAWDTATFQRETR